MTVQSVCLNPFVCDRFRCRARPAATSYHNVMLRWCVSSVFRLKVAPAQRRHSLHHLDTQTHKGTASTCFVQHSSSSASWSCEVHLRHPLDSWCASVCTVVVFWILSLCSGYEPCLDLLLHSHIRERVDSQTVMQITGQAG